MVSVASLVTTDEELQSLYDSGISFRPVSRAMIAEMDMLAKDVPSIESNLILLHQAVLGNGVDIRSDDRPVLKDVHDYINQMWVPVLQQFIRHYTLYGFAIISFEQGLPVLVHPLLVDVSFFQDDGFRRRYVVKHIKPGFKQELMINSVVKDIMLLELHPPSEEGLLTVPLVAALKFNTYVNALLACSVRASARMALPSMVTQQTTQATHLEWSTMVADSDDLTRRRQRMQSSFLSEQERARVEARAVTDSANLEALHAARRRAASGQAIPMAQLHPTTKAITFPLEEGVDPTFQPRVDIEPGRQVVSGPHSSLPHDPVLAMAELRRLIGTLMVVPDFIFGGGKYSASHSHVVMMVFFKAQQMHRKHIADLTKIFFFVFFGEHIKEDARLLAREVWAATVGEKVTELQEGEFERFMEDGGSEVFLKVATNIDVFLPTSLDLDLIRTLRGEGFLTWEGATSAVSAYFNLPRSMLEPEPPIMTLGSDASNASYGVDKSGMGAVPSVRSYVDGAARQGKRVPGASPSASSMASVGQVSGGK